MILLLGSSGDRLPLTFLGPQANLRSRCFRISRLDPIRHAVDRPTRSQDRAFGIGDPLLRGARLGPGNPRPRQPTAVARSDIRRLSFALIAQQLGLTLAEIEAELSTLPQDEAPTRTDWRGIGTRMRGVLARKIVMLQRTQELLDGCIGCGCLSLDRCALYNPNDRAARAGPGPRFLLGNKASDFEDN